LLNAIQDHGQSEIDQKSSSDHTRTDLDLQDQDHGQGLTLLLIVQMLHFNSRV